MLDLWLARFDRLLAAVNIALMGAMTAMVTTAVILRYVFSISFAWSEEAIALTFVMTSLLGAVYVSRRGEHIGIEFIFQRVPAGATRWVRGAVSAAVAVTMVVMANASLTWIDVSMTVNTPAMQLPYWWFYAVLPVSFVLISAVEMLKIVKLVSTSEGEGGK